MIEAIKDPTVLASIFGFLTACVVSLRWLMKCLYEYIRKAQLAKGEIDSRTEKLKAAFMASAIEDLQNIVSQKIVPVVREHTSELKAFKIYFDKLTNHHQMLATLVHDAQGVSQSAKDYFELQQQKLNAIQAGGNLISERIEKVEQDVVKLKGGVITYTRDKK